jgi:hypothetical protein
MAKIKKEGNNVTKDNFELQFGFKHNQPKPSPSKYFSIKTPSAYLNGKPYIRENS